VNRNKKYYNGVSVLLEGLAWFCALLALIIALRAIQTLPAEETAIHYSVTGIADEFGSPSRLLTVPVLCALFLLLSSVLVHAMDIGSWWLPRRDVMLANDAQRTRTLRMCTALQLELGVADVILTVLFCRQSGAMLLPVGFLLLLAVALTIFLYTAAALRRSGAHA